MATLTQVGRATWNTPRFPSPGALVARIGRFAAMLIGTPDGGDPQAERAARIEAKMERGGTMTASEYWVVGTRITPR